MTALSEKSNEHISATGKVRPETEESKEGSTQDPVFSTLPPAPKYSLNKQTSPEGNCLVFPSPHGVELNTTGTYTGSSEDEMQVNEESAIENS
jgi:hypothetical protein